MALGSKSDDTRIRWLLEAVEVGDAEVVSLLVNSPGAQAALLSQPYGTGLHAAAARGYDPIVRILLDRYPCLVDATDHYGNTPLHSASQHGQISAVATLLNEHPSLAHKRNLLGCTALHLAADANQKPVADLLLRLVPALADIRDLKGRTATDLSLPAMRRIIERISMKVRGEKQGGRAR